MRSLKIRHHEVRSLKDLHRCTHLIIPGGESTVMSRFLELTGVGKGIQARVRDGSLAVYGTCAGAILLAKKVTGKHPPKTLKLLDITIERNAYGTQLQSFDARLNVKKSTPSIRVAFIRAPVIRKLEKGMKILGSYGGHPVLVRSGRVLAGTFHPELRDSTDLHALFLKL